MEFGKSKRKYKGVYSMGKKNINKKGEKDLGVAIVDNMSPEKHVNMITGATYNLLGNIRVTFTYVDRI